MGRGAVWGGVVGGKKVELFVETPKHHRAVNFEIVVWIGRPEEGGGLSLPRSSTLGKKECRSEESKLLWVIRYPKVYIYLILTRYLFHQVIIYLYSFI